MADDSMPDTPQVTVAGSAPEVELAADCAQCFGLCCVVPAFAASADFAIDKPAGTPCPNLAADFGCGIHSQLRERGFAGCTAYDCFGAGQRVSQVTFGGVDWRSAPGTAAQMYAVFPVVRALHEFRRHLGEARRHLGEARRHPRGVAAPPHAPALADEVERLDSEVESLAAGDPAALQMVDLDRVGPRVGELLARVSRVLRADGAGPDLGRRDLAGSDLRSTDLRGANLRGALLLGADLRGCDLSRVDLLGADLRGARLGAADLSRSLFLTQPQVSAAAGDGATVLPPGLQRPSHWA